MVPLSPWQAVVSLQNGVPAHVLRILQALRGDVKGDAVLMSLRNELYSQDYDHINWDAYRQTCAEIDEYAPLRPVMKVAQDFLAVYEEYFLPYCPPLRKLRENALKFVIEYIHAEDLQTNYVDIGPVNKALNMLSVWVDAGGDDAALHSEAMQRHIPRIDDYLWVAEDGMKMQGYNGSQCWDTSFAVQAIVGEAGRALPRERQEGVFLPRSHADRRGRGGPRAVLSPYLQGGWPFSTAAHGWPISDCTAEGLKGVLSLHKGASLVSSSMHISDERLQDAVNVILSYHNEDGGWATYENNRGYGWYEMLNPARSSATS